MSMPTNIPTTVKQMPSTIEAVKKTVLLVCTSTGKMV